MARAKVRSDSPRVQFRSADIRFIRRRARGENSSRFWSSSQRPAPTHRDRLDDGSIDDADAHRRRAPRGGRERAARSRALRGGRAPGCPPTHALAWILGVPEDPHADCAPLEPSAAAAAVAALLQVNPVEPVDAQASSQVRHSPHGTAGSPDPTHAIPPTFPFLDASADPSETSSSNIRAHSRTAQVASLLDRDPSRRPGTVIVRAWRPARAASALEDFLAAPRGAAPSGKTGASSLGARRTSARCTPRWTRSRARAGVARVRVGDADIGDPVAFGDAIARAVAEARHQSRGGGAENATSATLVMCVGSGGDGFFVETEDATGDVAFADVIFASARASLERARARARRRRGAGRTRLGWRGWSSGTAAAVAAGRRERRRVGERPPTGTRRAWRQDASLPRRDGDVRGVFPPAGHIRVRDHGHDLDDVPLGLAAVPAGEER